MPVRIDKWLQVARIFKTRTLAAHACDLGRVKVNGSPVKPHRHLALADRIEVMDPHWPRVLVVVDLRDRPLPKAQAATLFEDQSPPRPQPDPFERAARRPPALREKGSGRPTKKERREIDRWGREED